MLARFATLAALTALISPTLVRSAAAEIPLIERTPDGFAVPQPGAKLEFPRDHGSHPDFRIEWWYITGHLRNRQGKRFGFQATFFRSAVTRNTGEHPPEAFGTRQLFLAHMSVLDADTKQFVHEERLNRDGWDAWAGTDRLDLANGNWTLAMSDPATESMHLVGSVHGGAKFEIDLRPEKPHVVFGKDGVSRKGASPTAASIYITFPRLAATGTLQLGGKLFVVDGRAWMDHEISSSQLAPDQVGWDWCCMQLDDGWDLMAYRMRRDDGSTDPFSTLDWISPEGRVVQLDATQFSSEPLAVWTSPATGGRYPVRYRLRTLSPVDNRPVVLELRPLAPDQEITGTLGGIPYWEGACDVLGESGTIIGQGYSELTGYAQSLQGKF